MTLTWDVGHYGARGEAEQLVKKVRGVKAVANEIDTKIVALDDLSDTAIAEAVTEKLNWKVATRPGCIPTEGYTVVIDNQLNG